MPKDFAKIYNTERGQIVAMALNNDDGDPEIRFYFNPSIPDLNVCEFAVAFGDEDKGEEQRDIVFAGLLEEGVRKETFKHMDRLATMFAPTSTEH